MPARGASTDHSGPTRGGACMAPFPSVVCELSTPLDQQQDAALHGGSPMARVSQGSATSLPRAARAPRIPQGSS
eukprot:7195072-Pyramimonas_sp.AAC.1